MNSKTGKLSPNDLKEEIRRRIKVSYHSVSKFCESNYTSRKRIGRLLNKPNDLDDIFELCEAVGIGITF